MPISTEVPVRRYASRLKNLSIGIFGRVKNALNHLSVPMICLVQVVLNGAVDGFVS